MTYMLEGLGRLPWAEVCGAVGRATCSWVDLDGIQVGPAPSAAPPCTHLWAWEEDRWVRVRVDGTEGIVGVLTHGGRSGGEPVTVDRRLVRTWRPDEDQRVRPLPEALAGREVELLTAHELRPLTFVGVLGLDGQ
ncbi:MAG: hypothetical protein ACRDZ4_11715 [Egibacteraceae bacterium]